MSALHDWTRTHLTPLGISDAQADADADAGDFAPEAYATPTALAALHRLRSARRGALTQVSTFAPILPPTAPITVATDPGDRSSVQIKDGSTTVVTSIHQAPAQLSALGVTMSPTGVYRTLVTDTAGTLRRLTAAAHNDPDQPASQVIDWWARRADHPTSAAVLIVAARLPQHWAPPVPPSTHPHLTDWATWLHLPHTPLTTAADCTADLAGLLTTSAPLLPGLTHDLTGDSRDHTWAAKSTAAWRWQDSRAQAAMGLATRSQAAEMWEHLRLQDPLAATIATRTGTVVQATITTITATPNPTRARGRTGSSVNHVELETCQPVMRHRPGATLSGRLGDAVTSCAQVKGLTGTLETVTVDSSGAMTLALGDVINLGVDLHVGDALTLRPRGTQEFTQRSKRTAVGRAYRHPDNWLARREAAPVMRRQVPLDVVIAAATDTN